MGDVVLPYKRIFIIGLVARLFVRHVSVYLPQSFGAQDESGYAKS